MKRFIQLIVAALMVQTALGAMTNGNYVVVIDGKVDSQIVARSHGAVRQKHWKDAINGFSAKLTAKQAEALSKDSRVVLIEPDVAVHALSQSVPTGIRRIGCLSNTVWRASSTTPVDADIAIIDTGIDLSHPDLNVYNNVTFVSGTVNGNDDHGHGSHCAGIAAARNNDLGVVGVAPGARLWAVKVLNSAGSGDLSTIISGIDYVTQHASEIEVASMSLGGNGYAESCRLAIQNSVSNGVVYVVAAGNSHYDVYGADKILGTADDSFPACYPEVMTVSSMSDSDGYAGGLGAAAAYGKDDIISSFSSFSLAVDASNPVVSTGKAIDVAAPGDSIYSCYKNGGYATMSGTSMATPHVAGAVALYIAAHSKPTTAAGVYAIRQAIIDKAVPATAWGIYPPNINQWFQYSLEPLVNVSDTYPTNAYPVVKVTSPIPNCAYYTTNTVTFTATATDALDGNIASKLIWRDDAGHTFGTGASFTALCPLTWSFNVRSTNSVGLATSIQVPVSVYTVQTNTTPVVTITSPANAATVSNPVTFTGTATDGTDGTISSRIAWASSVDGRIGTGASVTASLSIGAHSIYACATNVAGVSTTAGINLTVSGTPPAPTNRVPVITITQPASGASFQQGATVVCTGSASDTEDGDLTTSIVWADNVSGSLGTGATVSYSPAVGSHTITATVVDSLGAAANTSRTITVAAPTVPLTVTASATPSSAINKQKVTLAALVKSGSTNIAGATVQFAVKTANNKVDYLNATTASTGIANYSYMVNSNKGGTGTWTVTATASKTGYSNGVGSTTFTVTR